MQTTYVMARFPFDESVAFARRFHGKDETRHNEAE